MNFLIISPNSPYLSVGGVERYIKNLIDFCQDQPGHFYFFLPAQSKDEVVKRKNATIYFLDPLTLSQKARRSQNTNAVSKKQIKDKHRFFFEFLNAFIDDKNINAVIAQNFHLGLPPAYSLLTNMACHAKNVPLFLQIHSFATNPLQVELINNLFWERIICVSKSVAGDTFQKGAHIKSLSTKYLGVSVKEFNPGVDNKWLKKHLKLSKESKIILSASRILYGYNDILKEKGFIDLIDAFSNISERDSSFRLLLAVGKPPVQLQSYFEDAMRKLEGFIQIHGVEDKVIIKTFKLEDMPRVYAGSDVFVLASENETFGQVFIEAMACGLPVIGTKVGGVPEIITDGFNGYLTIPNDPSFLGKKILDLLEDSETRERFISNGLDTVAKRFDSKKLFEEYFKFIAKYSKNSFFKKPPSL